MAYKAPTIEAISGSLRAAFRAAMPGTDPALFPNNLYVASKVFAVAIHGVYLRLEQLERDAHPSVAATESLERHATDLGLSRLPATLASGTVTAATIIGTFIPVGTRLKRADDAIFSTLADATATDVTTTLEVRAVQPGKKWNSTAGVALVLETPIAGVGLITVDDDGLRGGYDTENDASLRARVLLKKRNPAQGGSPPEYQTWALGLAGVTRVFVQRATPAPGQVTILFMMDDVYTNGIPLSADVAAMQERLNSLAPSDAQVNVAAPTPLPVDVTINSLTPDTPPVREAVYLELLAMFRRRAVPGAVFSRTWIDEAISSAKGEDRHQLTAPVVDINSGTGEIAVLGALAFI